MSSPFYMPADGSAHRIATASPASVSQPSEVPQSSKDVSIRPMRLKVLYTFDDQNRTNCLARWPQVLDIRTAYLDESVQIGVIELKTCIQAIVSASPELVAKLGQDYTVYAYDYSEYETPLVGQGMLSWVLASASTTPSAPAHQSRTIVTGRVCKNILGLFSRGVQETLEVKLRLVPVPSCLQSEYIESMRKYRDLSKIMPEGFDAQAWTAFLQENPGILDVAAQNRTPSPLNDQAQREFGIEHVQRLLRGGSTIGDDPRSDNLRQQYASCNGGKNSSRAASPALSTQSSVLPALQRQASETSWTGHNQMDRQHGLSRRDSTDTGYASNEERSEEGPARKRAKVTRADWPTKTGFGKQADSLRVAASTAASIRVYQPTAVRPSANAASSLEEPRREPTPIPVTANQRKRPLLPAVRSSLGRESYVMSSSEYKSPYAHSEGVTKPADSNSAMTSPEQSRADSSGNSPTNIGSSPPVIPGSSPAPSSPVLPTLPRDYDSGFMSGTVDDLFEDDENRPFDDKDLEIVSQYMKRPGLNSAEMGKRKASEENTPDSLPQNENLPRNPPTQSGTQTRDIPRTQRLNRTASSASLAPHPVPASDPIRPNLGTLQRSQTWAGQLPPHSASDAPTSSESLDAPKRRKSRASSARVRKQAIQSKLASSIAAGEVPPYCDNCGAVETPTWRKAWTKVHSGAPGNLQISDSQGGVVAWQPMQKDERGIVNLFKIIKKTLLPTDDGFSEILLCNPCGIYLQNRKCMRPPEIYQRNQKGPDDKPKRPSHNKKQKTNKMADESATSEAHSMFLNSSASSPVDETENPEEYDRGGVLESLPLENTGVSSVQLDNIQTASRALAGTAAEDALRKAIQSSPAQFLDTQKQSINVEDMTPKPTRRLLFPSPPKKDDHPKGLDGHAINLGKQRQESNFKSNNSPALTKLDQVDKENHPPDDEDSFYHLFNETQDSADLAEEYLRHPLQTPKKNRTPTKRLLSEDIFSSAARAFLHSPNTPKRTPTKPIQQPLSDLSPFTAQLNQLLFDAGNCSPSDGKLNFLSLPSLNSSRQSHARHDLDFSHLDSQELIGTDIPMPSSPPPLFGVYEDPIDHENGEFWDGFSTPRVLELNELDETTREVAGAKTPGLSVDDNGHARVIFDELDGSKSAFAA